MRSVRQDWASTRSRALRRGKGKTASVVVNTGHSGPEDTRFQTREQSATLPAVRCDEISVGATSGR